MSPGVVIFARIWDLNSRIQILALRLLTPFCAISSAETQTPAPRLCPVRRASRAPGGVRPRLPALPRARATCQGPCCPRALGWRRWPMGASGSFVRWQVLARHTGTRASQAGGAGLGVRGVRARTAAGPRRCFVDGEELQIQVLRPEFTFLSDRHPVRSHPPAALPSSQGCLHAHRVRVSVPQVRVGGPPRAPDHHDRHWPQWSPS